MIDEDEEIRWLVRELAPKLPRNDSSIESFSDFVSFCKSASTADISLAQWIGAEVPSPVRPIVFNDKVELVPVEPK